MAEQTTFFKIDRCIFDNWIWNEKPFDNLHAWIYLIGKANYADKKKIYKGRLQEIKRGQIQTSYRKLAEDWGWSRNKVIHFLKLLESDGMLHIEGTTLGTTLTLENYAKFQNVGYADSTTDGTALGTAQGTALGTHNKKEKKEKKEKNISPEIPTREIVSSFISSLGFNVDADKFFDYYEECSWTDSKGQPIRDWKRLVRAWDNNKPTLYEPKPAMTPMEKIMAEIKARKEAEQ